MESRTKPAFEGRNKNVKLASKSTSGLTRLDQTFRVSIPLGMAGDLSSKISAQLSPGNSAAGRCLQFKAGIDTGNARPVNERNTKITLTFFKNIFHEPQRAPFKELIATSDAGKLRDETGIFIP